MLRNVSFDCIFYSGTISEKNVFQPEGANSDTSELLKNMAYVCLFKKMVIWKSLNKSVKSLQMTVYIRWQKNIMHHSLICSNCEKTKNNNNKLKRTCMAWTMLSLPYFSKPFKADAHANFSASCIQKYKFVKYNLWNQTKLCTHFTHCG